LAADGIIPEAPWAIYCDGAWGSTGARAVTILVSPSGIKLRYTTGLEFHNEADKCIMTCTLRTDSKVVAGQIEK
jgi:hypothetical protein